MFEFLLGLGIIYTLFNDLNTLDDVSRLTDKIRKLEKANQLTRLPAKA